ncbi:MAG: hypothetical protein QME85_02350 [Candidatus Saccharicenans sp.]|nr:hypothetical protein [Candidatus Saccharicenans sp.]
MDKRGRLKVLILFLCFWFLYFCPGQAAPGSAEGQATQNRPDELGEVLGLVNFLEEAASFWQEKGHYQNRVAEFSQEQVAVFFRHLLSEGNPALKELRLKLIPGNLVEGWVILDLSSEGLGGNHNLYLKGKLEQAGRLVRLNLSSLFLETQRIQPEIVNALIDLVARARGLEARHLNDWYDLPEGIARVETGVGSLRIHY